MEQTVQERVLRVIAKTHKVSPEDIHLNQNIDELCEDSLDLVNLLFELEDEFDIDIPDAAKESKTIHDIVTGIEQLLCIQHSQDTTAA